MSESSTDHLQKAANRSQQSPARCAVLTVSDSRTPRTDKGGPLIAKLLSEHGHLVTAQAIVPDDAVEIRKQLQRWTQSSDVDAIITTGGTGIARRDVTVDVVREFLHLELDGFGELFRMISYAQVKAASMMSRAVAGICVREAALGGETVIFTLPGSPNAVETAMTLINPQLAHILWERRK